MHNNNKGFISGCAVAVNAKTHKWLCTDCWLMGDGQNLFHYRYHLGFRESC